MGKKLSVKMILWILISISAAFPLTNSTLRDLFNKDAETDLSGGPFPEKIHLNTDLKEMGTIGNKNYYIQTNLRTTWFEAWEICRQSGLVLAAVNRMEEITFIAKYLAAENLLVQAIWTSGTDLGRDGVFYWMSSGKEMQFTNWSIDYGQPDDGATGRSCVYGFGPRFEWMDLPCDLRTVSAFICQK